MREIKFRAKRVDNGEWVYGCLTRYSEAMSFITVELLENKVYEVHTKTIGQFTGLLDKNGKEIYEGDWFILKDKDIKYLVEWHDTGFSGRQYSKLRGKFGANSSWVGLLGYCKGHNEVIGTIHDKEMENE